MLTSMSKNEPIQLRVYVCTVHQCVPICQGDNIALVDSTAEQDSQVQWQVVQT